MAEVSVIEPGAGRVVLVVVAHADDPPFFLGGTIACWAAAGWRVVCVRVTDDRTDSVGRSEGETITANAAEFRSAAAVLGVDQIVDLGYPTDTLADAGEVELREQIIRLVRTHRPYALVTFDPYAMYGEDNQDHVVVATAVDEAFWTSQFDLHHPEHRADGLEPHGCFERWYFGRRVIDVTDVVDISHVIDRKIAAVLCHPTMLRNFVHQLRMQARTGGWEIPIFDDALRSGDLSPLLDPLLRRQAQLTGERHGLAMAEEFRVVRFGGLEALLDGFGVRLDESGPGRPGEGACDR